MPHCPCISFINVYTGAASTNGQAKAVAHTVSITVAEQVIAVQPSRAMPAACKAKANVDIACAALVSTISWKCRQSMRYDCALFIELQHASLV
jgi:hypothetical protein